MDGGGWRSCVSMDSTKACNRTCRAGGGVKPVSVGGRLKQMQGDARECTAAKCVSHGTGGHQHQQGCKDRAVKNSSRPYTLQMRTSSAVKETLGPQRTRGTSPIPSQCPEPTAAVHMSNPYAYPRQSPRPSQQTAGASEEWSVPQSGMQDPTQLHPQAQGRAQGQERGHHEGKCSRRHERRQGRYPTPGQCRQ